MWDSSQEPCCMAVVTSGGRDEHEPGCPEALERAEKQAAYDDQYPPLDPPWWESR